MCSRAAAPSSKFGSIRGEEGPTERRNKVLRGFEEEKVERYLTDVFTDEATGFIERSAGGEEPFFLYLSHTTPHTPLQATAEYLDGYRHIEDPRTRVYAAMVASLDESVRRVVETLKAQGVYENTLIAFASDNGCAGYIGHACSNGPLFGFKRYHHEGGVRVPFIISWPEMIQGGQTFDDPVITLDYMATFTADRRQRESAAVHDRGSRRRATRVPALAGRSEPGDPGRPVQADQVEPHGLPPREPAPGRPPSAAGGWLGDRLAPRPGHLSVRPGSRCRRAQQPGGRAA
ncbi:MAG: sulfatase-like hydrolase/transferase [Acidobacteria bacterium]|nr:sulfatase-like hydrolase/transferase [Acidobacteriota bacterium]